MVNATSLLLASAALLSSAVYAHPGPHPEPDHALLASRSLKAKKCSHEIGAMKQKRHLERKRELARKREAEAEAFTPPSYDFISNASCILTPETSNGPYWLPASEVFRQDIRENEAGVPMELEIGVIDVNTCEVMEGVLISVWHCNSTGYYSSFESHDPNTRFGVIAAEEGIPLNSTDFRSLQTSNSTFLRGMYPTDIHGTTSFSTIFPGFYIQRTVHIHVQVHTNWTLTEDGRVDSSRVIETGQIFASEELTEEIMGMEPYASHVEVARWGNDIDAIFNQASQSDAQAVMDAEPLDGEDFGNGVLGYITLAVDTSEIKDGAQPGQPLGGLPVSNISAIISASPWLTHYPESTTTAAASASATTTAA